MFDRVLKPSLIMTRLLQCFHLFQCFPEFSIICYRTMEEKDTNGNIYAKWLKPFHTTGHFLALPQHLCGFFMFSGGIERDQWHEMG